MNKLLVTMLLVRLTVTTAVAQEKTLLISESGLPYREQTWFAYGSEEIDKVDIMDGWNNGKRIVSAAYTKEGWLIVMAKNTNYSRQTFTLSEDWPEAWIADRVKEHFVVTSISKSEDRWLVVMSQNTGITRQSIWCNNWTALAPWIKEQTAQGFRITDLAFDGQQWTVVMSQNSKFASQGYLWADSTDELMRKAKEEVWAKGYNIHQVEYGNGRYIVVYGNFNENDGRYQNLQVNPDNPKEFIRQQWDRDINIAYVGGGLNGTH